MDYRYPAMSAAVAKLSFRTAGAYAKLRWQFNTNIGYFEGIQEKLAQIGSITYLIDAMRRTTISAIDAGEKPAVITAICKYLMTEMARQCITDAMDIHSGKTVMLGKKNYLAEALLCNAN